MIKIMDNKEYEKVNAIDINKFILNEMVELNEVDDKVEYIGGNKITDEQKLNIEMYELNMTLKIIRTSYSIFKLPKNDKYELVNCIERFLISMINSNVEKSKNFSVYKIFTMKTDFYIKYIRELIEKKILPKNREIINNYSSLIIKYIKNMIELYDKNKVDIKLKYGYSKKDNLLFYGNDFKMIPTKNMIKILDSGSESVKNENVLSVLRIAMRYCTVITGGQHWGITTEYYDYLYNNYNLRNEGFASILNTKSIYYNDCHFCSLFPDIEGDYGSLGSFFNVELYNYDGLWSINPPFTEQLILQTINRVIEQIEKANEKEKILTTFIFLPYWEDLINTSKILENKFTKDHIIIKSGEMFVEQIDGCQIPIKNKHIHILCTNLIDNSKINKLKEGLRKIVSNTSKINDKINDKCESANNRHSLISRIIKK
jgi:hypothetical protein